MSSPGMTSSSTTQPSTSNPSEPIRLTFGYDRDPTIAILTFDKPGSSANLFDAAAFDALEHHLTTLHQRARGADPIKGVILISAKPGIFIAGADIQQFLDAETEADARALVTRGQTLFQRLAELPVPTIAAIHGACVGGGCEIALACDYRIASPDKPTKIGLPEVKLGIVPGWGGCTRLPRLIGVPNALNIICGGRTLAAKPAKKRGLIDQVVPREHLLRIAATYLDKGKRKPPSLWKTNNALMVKLARRKTTAMIKAKSGNHYPAPLRAMQVVLDGISRDPAFALKLEEDAIVELGRSATARNLIHLFFLQERAKKMRIGDYKPDKNAATKPVAVLGAGLMGSAIAQWTAGRKHPVLMKDLGAEQLAKGLDNIRRLTDKAASRHVFTECEARQVLDRVTTTTEKLPAHLDLVIEAAVEDMAIKKKIFADLETQVGPDTILATNTSALSITELATATSRPERVVGIHFFNPVHRMQLVEIIRGEKTSDETVARSLAYVQSIGKLPVIVNDAPGFLVNRILLPYLLEAAHLVAGGADIEEVDQAMTDFGMPMGPLRLLDEIGLDTSLHVGRYFAETFPDRIRVPAPVPELIEKGYLGKKSKIGYYTHPKKGEPLPNPMIASMIAEQVREQTAGSADAQKYAHLSPMDIQTRLVGLMVNESARVLEEGVVASPEDVDFAMVMGTGFAPFHAGPLRMTDAAGVVNICNTLEALAQKDSPHYAPCAMLKRLAESGGTFYS